MMKIAFRLVTGMFALMLGGSAVVVAQGRAEEPIRTTLCELAKDPRAFNGRMVRFRASLIGGRRGQEIALEDFTIAEGCSAYMNIVMEMPTKVMPRPKFSFENDLSSQQYEAALREPVTIEATLEGRFDASFAWRDKKRIRVGDGDGFGRKRRADGRLVVLRLSEVVTHYVYRR